MSQNNQDIMDGKGGLMLGPHRYMMIRPDALMGLFLRLPEAERLAALEAFAASITENGGKSAASYAGAGLEEADQLIGIIMQTAPQLGWGQWQLARQPDGLDLQLANSPFVAGFGAADHPVCAPVRGMLAALSRQIFGREARVEESDCAAVTGGEKCCFTARIAAS